VSSNLALVTLKSMDFPTMQKFEQSGWARSEDEDSDVVMQAYDSDKRQAPDELTFLTFGLYEFQQANNPNFRIDGITADNFANHEVINHLVLNKTVINPV
jgi:hypothetical protein